ncbi:MAG: DUF853 family protein [Anaerolineae bacterium]|nr:DUF853 family protein [Anaerolineae bacterium]
MAEARPKGLLYLGKEYDVQRGQLTDRPVLYDVRHLTTHGVILGMTGSGKTGLGMVLLEEVLLQGVPVLMLDPKGDLVNLLLTFPDLRPEDFLPWVDSEDARRRGVSVEELAAETARTWREGLDKWGLTSEDIARLRQTVHFTVFTPGSEAGCPVNVLHCLDAPAARQEDEEVLRERVSGLISALLGLVGVEADPLQSHAHILLSRIVEHVWRAGESLDLPTLIRLLQHPPFQQVGVFELEAFLPQKERLSLARVLNNLIAAPGFEAWRKGSPLDIGKLLYADDGRPQASIFYLAHLNDAQRMFFVTLFLEAARDWLRVQSGTTNLRALIYFDEVFGYFPPYPANPPSKASLMALVKQGRAAGLGVVLATQNPADLDYKGLTNAGTWAIGLLRTERDKQRILEGLEGVVSETGAALDLGALEKALSALRPRVFLFHDIRAGAPLFLHTRWAMSYLYGPLTRKQVRELVKQEVVQEEPVAESAGAGQADGPLPQPPALTPDVPQMFLTPTTTFEWALRAYEERSGQMVLAREKHLVYVPYVLASGRVRFLDPKRGVDHLEHVVRLVRPGGSAGGVDWSAGELAVNTADLSPRPAVEGGYAAVDAALSDPRKLKELEKDFANYLYYNVCLTILHNPTLGLYGRVGESRRDFRIRCEDEARRRRDQELSKARLRMEQRMAQVQERMRREERELAADQKELEARKREELLSLGEAVLNLFPRRRSTTVISHITRKRTLTELAKAEVEESLEALADLEQQLETLQAQWQEEASAITDRWAETLERIEEIQLTPRRTDVTVEFCGLAWVPVWRVLLEDGRPLELPAYAAGHSPTSSEAVGG